MSDPDTIIATILAHAGRWIDITYQPGNHEAIVTDRWWPTGLVGNSIAFIRRHGSLDSRRTCYVSEQFNLISIEEIKP